MMRMRKAMAAAVVVLAAMSASAQETDAETRFHRAYEREVVDGKVADAAREYLAMMDDEKFPERLRLEAKFRFAVTAMLLGRADEARVHFGAIAADAKAPETLRARATEYLDAAKGVGVGNEIDKKLQSLVFDLAKDKEPVPAAYRDFEVIGKRAVPFLRQLLAHDDLRLRVHAFRLLGRMGAAGLGAEWKPELTAGGQWSWIDLSGYLRDRADEHVDFERRLLALDDEALGSVLGGQMYPRPQFSAETLRAFAARKVPPSILLACFPSNWTVETDRVRGEWIAGDDAKLSEEATLSYLRFAGELPAGNIALRTDLFPAMVARLETMPLQWRLEQWQGKSQDKARVPFEGLLRVASAIPAESLLDTLAAVVDHGIAADTTDANPLKSGLAETLAIAVERREPEAPLPERYGQILRKWLPDAAKRSLPYFSRLYSRVHAAISRMPDEAATALAVWAVTTPWPGTPGQGGYMVPTQRARDVPIALAAIRAADRDVKAILVSQVEQQGQAGAPEYSREYLRVLPELVRVWIASGQTQGRPPVVHFIACARTLPAEEARDRFVEMADAVAEIRDAKQRSQCLTSYLLGAPAPNEEDRTSYWVGVALPSLDRVWPKLEEGDRRDVLVNTLALLERGPRDPSLRASIGQFVKARYGEVPDYAAGTLARAPDVFPLTEWVPNVCPDSGVNNNAARVTSERADPAVREMTTDVASVNAAVLTFTSLSASPDVQRDVFDRMLRTGPIERMEVVSLYARSASPEAVEEALRRVLAEKKPDLAVVSRLVAGLLTLRPSEALIPAVRTLLASETGERFHAISYATALGREELLPDLARILDSMNPAIRTAAKEAIDAIVALRKLKEEARRGAGGK